MTHHPEEQIRLEPITPDNWREEFSLKPNQECFVSNPNRILARAWAYREHRSKSYMIYEGDKPIGMAMYYDADNIQAYNFSQFFIDRKYQGHGFGKAAALAVLNSMIADGKYSKVYLCYVEGNEAARCMYESLGFIHTGEKEVNEIGMMLDLSQLNSTIQ